MGGCSSTKTTTGARISVPRSLRSGPVADDDAAGKKGVYEHKLSIRSFDKRDAHAAYER